MKNDIIAILAIYGGYRIIKDICIYLYQKNYAKDILQKPHYDKTYLKDYGKVLDFKEYKKK